MQKKFLIHYACADLEPSPQSVVTAISIYDLLAHDAYSFSLYEAQKELGDVPVEVLEAKMLQRFYDFVAVQGDALWIHWHMHTTAYGFEVLEERYRLRCKKEAPPILQRENLPDTIFISYEGKCTLYPKMLPMLQVNGFGHSKILSGEEEAKAYRKKQYKKIADSSAQKVLSLANLYYRFEEGALLSACKAKQELWWIMAMTGIGLALWLFWKV